MAVKLTNESIDARLTMYDEAWEHLTMSVHNNAEEERQAKFVITQIKRLKQHFENYVGRQVINEQIKKYVSGEISRDTHLHTDIESINESKIKE